MTAPPALLMPAAVPAQVALPEAQARAVCLLQACEGASAQVGGGPLPGWWTEDDVAWASRMADASLGEAATPPTWLAERARLALPRLLPRHEPVARAFHRKLWRVGWLLAAAVLGLVAGLAADLVGPTQQINLLAAPMWAIVAWNLGVVALLAVAAMRRLARSRSTGAGEGDVGRGAEGESFAPGPIRRWLAEWLLLPQAGSRDGTSAPTGERHRRNGPVHLDGNSPPVALPWASAVPEQRFAALWARASAPLAASRVALLLHVAAMTLGLGLVLGLYARALVLDYRVAWQSTLLESHQAHAVLNVLLGPASAATGLAVPGVAAVAALRVTAGARSADAAHPLSSAPSLPAELAVAGTGAAAAPWLHLLAATLVLAVVLPRGLLAAGAYFTAARRASHLRVRLDDARTPALLAQRWPTAERVRRVEVAPHGFAPAPASVLALRGLLAALWGEQLEMHVAPSTAYGDEENAWRDGQAAPTRAGGPGASANQRGQAMPHVLAPQEPAPPPGSVLRLAWFDLAATPEAQAQGRFVEAGLAASTARSSAPLALLVDEAGYRQRMGAHSPRVAERQHTWRAFAEAQGVPLLSVNLHEAAANREAAASRLRVALGAASGAAPRA